MSTFECGLLISSRCQIGSYKKEMDFTFYELLKTYVDIHFINLLHINSIKFSNQKVGLNTFFNWFQMYFLLTFKIHLLLIFLKLDSYKLNRTK
jgi:hypothetical protein